MIKKILQSPFSVKEISFNDFIDIIEKSKIIFEKEPYVLKLNASSPQEKILIIGDIHGNLPSLVKIKEKIDKIKPEIVLFLGDIVDRGLYQLECLCFILCLKITEPERYFLLKGNHETIEINRYYGFLDVLLNQFGDTKYMKYLLELYNSLSLCSIINKKIFCVHGGIPEDIEIIKKLKKLDKKPNLMSDPEISNEVFQMIWNDPIEHEAAPYFVDNFRGEGIKRYGYKAFEEFMVHYGFKSLIRSHEIFPPQGYQYFFNGRLLTIFSSNNYRGQFAPNPATIALIEDSNVELIIIQ